MNRTKNIILLVCLIFVAGCVQMRDYTGVKEGSFGLDIKRGFGEGADKREYYLINESEGLAAGDSKNEIVQKIGLPDNIETTLEGYERWVYKNRKLGLIFQNNRLKEWIIL